ncbi:unnamed protein product [Phytophthora fragariaefolia]|uniref:Unnamed protein product n=1 Tax=Phytophthora fragariaefolia TaxID=1490495 RepID=A0A9W7CU37_9STRA|nr:unnamed protein product [Phytophthora fragariaefolia]
MDDDTSMGSAGMSSNSARPAAKKLRRSRPAVNNELEDRQKTATDALVRWICGSLEPLSTVTEGGLINLIGYLSQGTQIFPDRSAMCRIVEKKAAEFRFTTMEKVRHCVDGPYSLSAELWSMHYDMKYVALMCHHLNKEFEPETFPMAVIYVPPPEDGGAKELAKLMKGVFREWSLPEHYLSLLLTSSDTTIRQVASILEAKRFPDIWSVVHNALVHWIRVRRRTAASTGAVGVTRTKQESQMSVAAVVTELTRFADLLDNNWEVKKKLFRAQSIGGNEDDLMIMKTDCKTWDKVYDFLSELMIWKPSIDQYYAFSAVDCTSGINKPTTKMWFVAEALVLLLRTLREVKQITTKDKARTLPFVIRCLVTLKQHLSEQNVLTSLKEHYRLTKEFDATDIFKDLVMLQKEIHDSITTTYDTLVSEFLWCSLLDPRYAKMSHIDDDKRKQCKLELTRRAIELNRKSAPTQGVMYRLLQEGNAESLSEVNIEEMRASVTDEVTMYLSEHEKRTACIADPFEWWWNNCERYPLLSALAREWLGAVGCSSVAIGALRREIPYLVVHDIEAHQDDEDPWETMANMLYVHVSVREPKGPDEE